MPTLHPVSPEAFRTFAAAFVGEAVTCPWFSDHAVLYLEIGRVIGRLKSGRSECEKHVFLGYAWTGAWPDGTAFDRHGAGIKEDLLEALPGLRILELSLVEGDEIHIRFDDELRLTSVRLESSDPVESPDEGAKAEDEGPDWELCNHSIDPPYFAKEAQEQGVHHVGFGEVSRDEMELKIDDLRHPAVLDLLAFHFRNMRKHSPEGDAHVLELDRLRTPDMTFWTAWEGGELLGCGALRELTETSGEIKSIRTHPERLRKGAARALLTRIIETARERGYERLSLETGSGPVFDAAVGLYEAVGFRRGAAFAEYRPNGFSRFFHLDLQ